MKELSSVLHKYINEGRNGRTDSLNSAGVVLSDEQLCDLWSQATSLEASLALYCSDIEATVLKLRKAVHNE